MITSAARRLSLGPAILLLLLCTESVFGQEAAPFEKLTYYVISSPSGFKSYEMDGQGRIVATVRPTMVRHPEIPAHPLAGQEVRGQATAGELSRLRTVLRQVRPRSSDSRPSSFFQLFPVGLSYGLELERRHKGKRRVTRIKGKSVHPAALALATDSVHQDRQAQYMRLKPLLEVLDAIYDRVVPPTVAEVSGRIEWRAGEAFLVGATETVRLEAFGDQERLARQFADREVTARGYVARPAAAGQPRVLTAARLVSPFFVRWMTGRVRLGGGEVYLKGVQVVGADGGSVGAALASVKALGGIAELMRSADGRRVKVEGYLLPGANPELLVTRVTGRTLARTRLIEPKGRVARITRGKEVEVFHVSADGRHVRVRTWGWYFTRGTGTLPVSLVSLGERDRRGASGASGALGAASN